MPGDPIPGADPGDLLAAPHADFQIVLKLLDVDDEEEIRLLLDDYGGVSYERIEGTSWIVMFLHSDTDLTEVMFEAAGHASVLSAEPNYLTLPEGGPADQPAFGSDLLSAIPTQPALADLNVSTAHEVSTGSGAVVAVVDTGLDFAHPVFAGRLQPGGFDFVDGDTDPTDERDFIDNDGDGTADEQFGHGTFVASLVLAIAPNARILPVRALNAEGLGTSASVAQGIIWAVDRGAHVVNVSLGLPKDPRVVREAIEYAKDRGVVVVAAAGNSGAQHVLFPARLRDVVAVTAVDGAGMAPAFANVGSHVSLVAPGVDVVGAMASDASPTGTARWSGTSFATPIVAGTAALVCSAFPKLSGREIVDLLEDTAVPVKANNPGLGGELGKGRVNPPAALGISGP